MQHNGRETYKLPTGWSFPDADTAQRLIDELQRELPPGHLLAGCAVETIAWTDGLNDDVLFRDLNEPAKFTIVHLTWRGSVEIDMHHPTVIFDGSFDQFLRYVYGVEASE